MRVVKATIPLLAALGLACGGGNDIEELRSTMQELGADVGGQTEWVEIDGVEFPAAMVEAPAEVREAYVFAAKHPEVLRYMPCYCGCEDPRFAHQHNYDCFIDAIDTTGAVPRVDPDPMGFG